MRRAALIAILVVAAVAVVVVGLAAQGWLASNAIALQKAAQNSLAAALRALRAGQPGAVAGFLGLCFAHGFLHAVGPGHGKAVIAAYSASTPAPISRLAGIAAASSLAQAGVAVAVVYAGVWMLDGARARIEGLAARIEPLSFAVVALLGVLLLSRGARHLAPLLRADHDQRHHHHDGRCGCCHAHNLAPETLATARNPREVAAIILGIALRPCTSALFLLILTWRLGLDAIGIVGAFVMGLGTMMVTISTALLAALMRRGTVLALPEGRTPALMLAGIETLAGLAIVLIAGGTALRLI